jgi:hypothetical protein
LIESEYGVSRLNLDMLVADWVLQSAISAVFSGEA